MPTYAVSAGRSGKEDSTLEILVSGREVNGGVTIPAGSEGDNEVTTLVFSGLPLLASGQTVSIHWAAEVSGSTVGSVDALTKQTGVYKYEFEITDTISQYTHVDAYLQIVSGDKKWNSYAFAIEFGDLPDADGSATPPDPTLIDEVLAALNEAIQDVEDLEDTMEAHDAARSASVTKSGRTATISISDPSGTTTATVTDGATFTPAVSDAGVISWTNDAGETNPESVDLVAAVIAALPSAVGVSF